MQARTRDRLTRHGSGGAGASVPAMASVPRWAGWFFVVVGVGVAGLWTVSLPKACNEGLNSYVGTLETGTIPLFHVLAEGLMAAASLWAGVAILRERRRARSLALVASGMLVYSSISASGWLLRNQPATLLVTGATLIGSALVVAVLLGSERSP